MFHPSRKNMRQKCAPGARIRAAPKSKMTHHQIDRPVQSSAMIDLARPWLREI
jgi:hypothetical protein